MPRPPTSELETPAINRATHCTLQTTQPPPRFVPHSLLYRARKQLLARVVRWHADRGSRQVSKDSWLTHSHPLSLTHSHSHSLTLTLIHSHSLSLTLTHSHSLTLTLTHSLLLTLTLTHSLSLTLTLTLQVGKRIAVAGRFGRTPGLGPYGDPRGGVFLMSKVPL